MVTRIVKLVPALAAAFFLFACGETPAPGADHIFINAKAYTLDVNMPRAEAVVIAGDEIVYVGENAGALEFSGKKTTRHDLAGQMLLPGFIDKHMHPVSGGAYANALSLNTFGDVDEWVQAIAGYSAANSEAPLIFGYGWLSTTFGPAGPTRQMIDKVVSDRPVLIMDEVSTEPGRTPGRSRS